MNCKLQFAQSPGPKHLRYPLNRMVTAVVARLIPMFHVTLPTDSGPRSVPGHVKVCTPEGQVHLRHRPQAGRQGQSPATCLRSHPSKDKPTVPGFPLSWTINTMVVSCLAKRQGNALRIAQVLQQKLVVKALRQTYLPH